MKKVKTRMTISRLSTTILVVLLSKPSAAADIAFNAYLEFPLGGGSPSFGLRANPSTRSFSGIDNDSTEKPQLEFELRYGAKTPPTFLVNGFPIRQSLILNASDGGESQATENGFDWWWLGAAALGVGVIVAATHIDFGDSNVSVCSGTNCPPEEKPPPEPEPTD